MSINLVHPFERSKSRIILPHYGKQCATATPDPVFSLKGFAFIDLEWGISHEDYLTGQRGGGGLQPVTLEKPICVYKTLSFDTKISDPNVFNKWRD